MLLLFAATSLAQSYTLTNESAGLDTWNTSRYVVYGSVDAFGNPTRIGDQRNEVTLPWSFVFFGKSYSSVFASSNYFLSFVDIGHGGNDDEIVEANFRRYIMIAPLWTDGASEDIVYMNEYSDRVVFTWDGIAGGGTAIVQAVLYKTGDIRLRYSTAETGSKPKIVGISAGDSTNYYHNAGGTDAPTAYYKYVTPAAATAAPTVTVAKNPPIVSNFTSFPNITKRSQIIQSFFTIVDDVSVDDTSISARLVPKEGSQLRIGKPTFYSGNEKSGNYNLTWQVPRNATSGTYDVSVFACDRAGNCDTKTVGNFTINGSLFFNFYDEIKDSYNQTDEIILRGEVQDFQKNRVKANLTLGLSYPGGKYTFRNETEFGRFVLKYRTSLLDALGDWTIDLTATDVDGNGGSFVKKVPLKQPQAFFYYKIVYLSPINDSTYYRGENVRVSVKVLDLDKPVGEADVSLKIPTGELIQMSELSPGIGIYQTNYRIKFGDKIGDWVIGIESLKLTETGLFAGSKSIKINVRSIDLKVDIISPTKTHFAIDDTVKIKVRVRYPDNSAAESISVNATPVKKSLALVETQSGIYEGSYKFTRDDKGRYPLKVFAIDPFDNLGFVEKTMSIVQPNLLDLFIQLWYITIPGTGLIGYTFLHAKLPSILLRYYKNRLRTLEELKKSTQDKYFAEESIDEVTYKKLIQDTDREIVEIKTKIKTREELLSKKGKGKPAFDIRDLISGIKQKVSAVPTTRKEETLPGGWVRENYEKWYKGWKKSLKKPTKTKQRKKDKYEQEYKVLVKRRGSK